MTHMTCNTYELTRARAMVKKVVGAIVVWASAWCGRAGAIEIAVRESAVDEREEAVERREKHLAGFLEGFASPAESPCIRVDAVDGPPTTAFSWQVPPPDTL